MTKSATVHSRSQVSAEAGREIGSQLKKAFDGESPDAVILFASARHDFNQLLRSLHESCEPKALVGSSSAGEFTTHAYDEGAVSAVAFRSSEMQFTATVGRDLREDRDKAARAIVAKFKGNGAHRYTSKSALVLTDALAGHADDFVEQLTKLTVGEYQLFGGGAGDDAKFTRTHVFCGIEAIPDAAVALEILSDKPLGIGVRHSWEPATPPMRVTEAEHMRVISLNNVPAAEAFKQYAAKLGQTFKTSDPIPFFLHNVLGISTPAGFKLRVPLSVNEDGSIQCAADVPVGSIVHIMTPRGGSAAAATKAALDQLQGEEPEVALFFDCVATRLRMGREFGFELEQVKQILGSANYAGCNTYGQIARSEGQFSGFHNCTAVVAVFPK
jgi:hypothetical protein